MLTVVCVECGEYQGCGQRYVRILRDSVARNLGEHRFVCLSDRMHECETLPLPDLRGWWSKVFCFAPGLFKGRVLYIDLDNVITGRLEPIVENKGLVWLEDWGWKKRVYSSSVMVWDAGEHAEIYERFTPDVAGKFEGDQDWITHVSEWPRMQPGLVRSYRYECKEGPPPGTRIVATHGKDKPHLLTHTWLGDYWR